MDFRYASQLSEDVSFGCLVLFFEEGVVSSPEPTPPAVRVEVARLAALRDFTGQGLVERRAGVGLFVNPVRQDRKRRIQNELLEQAMNEAAGLAVQLGLEGAEAEELFNEYFENNRLKQKRKAE